MRWPKTTWTPAMKQKLKTVADSLEGLKDHYRDVLKDKIEEVQTEVEAKSKEVDRLKKEIQERGKEVDRKTSLKESEPKGSLKPTSYEDLIRAGVSPEKVEMIKQAGFDPQKAEYSRIEHAEGDQVR